MLAPDFSVSALLLIFFPPVPEVVALLDKIHADEREYRELNVRVFGIGRAGCEELARIVEAFELSFALLADPAGEAWRAYSKSEKTETAGFGVFVLDMYGGVDSQKVSETLADFPDARTILEWARAAQYRCNI
jgi:peroxiredoxin